MKRIVYFLIGMTLFLSALNFQSVRADDSVISIGELTVHFIDVGQGDACIVELPDDRTMLIDAGENKKEVRDKLDDYISANIKDDDGQVISYFDFVILTHSDSDHIGSMAYILENYHAKTVYRPNQECKYHSSSVDCTDPALEGENERNRFWGEDHGSKSTATYHKALEAAYEYSEEVIVTNPYDDTQNTIVSSNDFEYEINFYSPLSPDYTDNNNYSPIIVIEYQGKKIVVTGDAEKNNELEFVKAAKAGEGRYSVFDETYCVDVIKLGHHGSRTSSNEEYLEVMTSAAGRREVFVIISCGEGNSYGHPHPEVLERLIKMNFDNEKILRTDTVGDICIKVYQADGKYKVAYIKDGVATEGKDKETLSPQTPSDQKTHKDIVSVMKDRFMALPLYIKIIIIVVIVVIVVLVLTLLIKSKRKKRRRR